MIGRTEFMQHHHFSSGCPLCTRWQAAAVLGIEAFRIRARQGFDTHRGEPTRKRNPRDGNHSARCLLGSGTTTVPTNSGLHTHNTFDQRNEVTPQGKDLQSTGRVLTFQIPPALVTKMELGPT
jgi:hypothetical protein